MIKVRDVFNKQDGRDQQTSGVPTKSPLITQMEGIGMQSSMATLPIFDQHHLMMQEQKQ